MSPFCIFEYKLLPTIVAKNHAAGRRTFGQVDLHGHRRCSATKTGRRGSARAALRRSGADEVSLSIWGVRVAGLEGNAGDGRETGNAGPH